MRKGFVLFIGLALMIGLTVGCSKAPIKIGFIGTLSSKNSQLSVDARNAIALGVERINESGGINGRSLELVVKDDKNENQVALEKHQEYSEEGVSFIIGHMTSSLSDAVLASQNGQFLFISPTMGGPDLTGKDDWFLRTAPLTNNQVWPLYDLMSQLSAKKTIIVYDRMNAAYSESMAHYAVENLPIEEGLSINLVPFDSRVDTMREVSERILKYEDADLVFFISQAVDTAVLAQYIRKTTDDVDLASVSWSMTEDLILNGGTTVEDMYFVGLYVAETPSQELLDFKEAYYEKYQYEASFVSVMAYDALSILVDGLKNADPITPESVKTNILQKGVHKGLDETFEIDAYGDNSRRYLLYKLQDSKFIPLYSEE